MRRLPAVLALAPLAGCGSASPVAPGPGWTTSTGPRSGAELVLDFEQTLMALGGGQYKLQIDKGVPSCRIAGTRGDAVVKAEAAVQRERWYRLTCTRHDDEVTLTVRDLEATSPVSTFRAGATVGAVVPDEDLPLAVGGKVGENGRPFTSSTDQFNGSMDNVHYALLDAGDSRG